MNQQMYLFTSQTYQKRPDAIKESSASGLWIDAGFIALIPLLLNVSNHIGGSGGRAFTTGLFLLFSFKNLIFLPTLSSKHKASVNQFFSVFFSKNNKILFPTLFFTSLTIIAELRGYFTQVATFFSFAGQMIWLTSLLLTYFSSFAIYDRQSDKNKLIFAVLYSLPIYIFVNLILYIAGLSGSVEATDNGANKILSLIGITVSRSTFYLGGGLNNFGLMAGISLISGISLLISKSTASTKTLGTISTIGGLTGVAMADTRGALLTVLVIVPMLIATKYSKKKSSINLLAIVILPAIPLIGIMVIPLIQNTELGSYFQREGQFAARLGIASGRDIVWRSVINELSVLDPINIVGHGAYGQFVSGATKGYAWIFGEVLGQTTKSTHNATLQYAIDIGYIGLAAWLFWMYRILSISRSIYIERNGENSTLWLPLFGSTIFILLSGITEAAGTQYLPDSFAFLLATSILCGMRPQTDAAAISQRNIKKK